jgi:hypothetical protein
MLSEALGCRVIPESGPQLVPPHMGPYSMGSVYYLNLQFYPIINTTRGDATSPNSSHLSLHLVHTSLLLFIVMLPYSPIPVVVVFHCSSPSFGP